MWVWFVDGLKMVMVERVVENNYFEDKVFEKFLMIG